MNARLYNSQINSIFFSNIYVPITVSISNILCTSIVHFRTVTRKMVQYLLINQVEESFHAPTDFSFMFFTKQKKKEKRLKLILDQFLITIVFSYFLVKNSLSYPPPENYVKTCISIRRVDVRNVSAC